MHEDRPASATAPAVRPARAAPLNIYGIEVGSDRRVVSASHEDYPGEVKIHVVLTGGKSILLLMHPSTAAELGAAIVAAATLASTPEDDESP